MRARILAVAWLAGLLIGCHQSGEQPIVAEAWRVDRSVAAKASGRLPAAVATYPDKGSLFDYDHSVQSVRNGNSMWYPIRLSQEHALRAISQGAMSIEAPDGRRLTLKYSRHIEHPDGNWTWVGQATQTGPMSDAVLTFGEKAVFGVLPDGNGGVLRLTMESGRPWLVVDGGDHAKRHFDDEMSMLPPIALATGAPATAGYKGIAPVWQAGAADEPEVEAAPAWTSATVDVVLGYTSGFAERLGGVSQAVTRLNFLVDLTNQAYLASQIDGQIRLVRAVQVNYPDATSNRTALFEMTGVECTSSSNGTRFLPDGRVNCSAIARPTALQPLIDARETYGADLVALVRKFESPENQSCGISWLLGGGQGTIDNSSAAFGFAVVSDSSGLQFPDGGSTCREDTLAHELGHNMGQQHDVETARGSDGLLDPDEYGRHSYSFGYSTDAFYTIMSVRRPGQTGYRVFSNPALNVCGGMACGNSQQADNARSMNQTMPVVATFRATVVAFWDVESDYWAYDHIRRLFAAGITSGCAVDPPLYCPTAAVTRDQMAVFLLRAKHGSDFSPPSVTSSSFADVPNDHWAIRWIEQLYQEGITSGCGTNPERYCPSAVVSRDQMAVFLLRAKYGASYTPPAPSGVFQDVPANHWAAAWIENLAAEGITSGCSTSPMLYCPGDTVTRDQMAVFVVRAFGL